MTNKNSFGRKLRAWRYPCLRMSPRVTKKRKKKISKNIFLYKVHFRNARSEIWFESVYRLVLSSSYTLFVY